MPAPSVALSARIWWLLLGIVLVGGGWLHLTGYNYGVTMSGLTEWDDMRLSTDAYYQMHGVPERAAFPGYPPGTLILYHAAYTLLQWQNPDPSRLYTVEGIYLIRVWAVLCNVLTAALLALSGRALHGRSVGLLAPVTFFVMTAIIEYTVVALSESFQAAALMLTVWLAICALKQQRARYVMLSCAAALLMVSIKYSAYPALGIPIVVNFWLLWQRRQRRWLVALGTQGLLIVLVAFWLLRVYDARRLIIAQNEAASFVATPIFSVLTDPRALEIMGHATQQIALPLLLFIGIVTLGVGVYWRGAVGWQRLFVGGLCAFYVVWCILVLTYLQVEPIVVRYVTPIAPIGVLLASLALVNIAQGVGQRLRVPRLVYALLALVVAAWLLPNAARSFNRAYNLSLPSPHAAFIAWVPDHLPTDSGLVIWRDDWVYFQPNDFIEPASTPHTWSMGSLIDIDREDWLANNVRYAYLTPDHIAQLREQEGGVDDLAALLLLKQFPGLDDPQQWRNEQLFVYQLEPMQVTTDIVFGDTVRLSGYDLNASTFKAGDTLVFAPYWQSVTIPAHDYNVALQLIDAITGDIITQTSGQPAYAPYPTSAWTDLHEVIIGQKLTLALPATLPTGSYQLRMRLYDWRTNTPLVTLHGAENALITTLTIRD